MEVELVPEIEQQPGPHFLRGEFDIAVFAAMRQVEIAVRESAGLSGDRIGVTLIKEALGEGKPLWDPRMHGGEAVASWTCSRAHRALQESIESPTSRLCRSSRSAETIILADLLDQNPPAQGSGRDRTGIA
ncbi:MAG: hypothetical protein IPO93_04395 [Actinobacteria bacterium]|nr:hypothetical protein [Actinomycetota bacterium]